MRSGLFWLVVVALSLGPLGLGSRVAAAIDYAAAGGSAPTAVRFEIQQLDAGLTYDLTFFGSHKFNTDATTVYSVYTDNTYSTLVDTVSLDVHQSGSPWLHNRDTVATIFNVAPQASDILYVEFTGATGVDAYLNSMEISVVPEPTTFALLGLGAAALVGLRRRKA